MNWLIGSCEQQSIVLFDSARDLFQGGNSKALMFCQMSPDERDVAESLCSLKFAERVRSVASGPALRNSETAENARMKRKVFDSSSSVRFSKVLVEKESIN